MINNKDIQANGKLICEFLELSIRDKRAKSNPVYSISFSTIMRLDYCPQGGDPGIEQDTDIRASDTLFHSDWTWIMNVVDKIEDLGYPTIIKTVSNGHKFVVVLDEGKLLEGEVSMNKIEAVYKATLEFIKCHQKI